MTKSRYILSSPSPQTLKSPIPLVLKPQKPKRGLGLTLKSCRPPTHSPTRKLLSMKEGSCKKVQKVKMFQNGQPYLSTKKKFRWTVRGGTWSCPPSSARTSTILLNTSLSKCQGLTQKSKVRKAKYLISFYISIWEGLKLLLLIFF